MTEQWAVDPQIVVPGLRVICIWTCIFVIAPTTQQKILEQGKETRSYLKLSTYKILNQVIKSEPREVEISAMWDDIAYRH